MFSALLDAIRGGKQSFAYHPIILFAHWSEIQKYAKDEGERKLIKARRFNVVVALGGDYPNLYGTVREEQLNGNDISIIEFLATPTVVATSGHLRGLFCITRKGGLAELIVTTIRRGP